MMKANVRMLANIRTKIISAITVKVINKINKFKLRLRRKLKKCI